MGQTINWGKEITDLDEIMAIQVAFQTLMGMNGDQFAIEVIRTGKICEHDYKRICNNIAYNGKDSIVKYFGLVHYYYLNGKQ